MKTPATLLEQYGPREAMEYTPPIGRQLGKIVKFDSDLEKYKVSFDEQWCGWYAENALHQGPPSREAIQYADYILNHYSRHSYADKICLARDLERENAALKAEAERALDVHLATVGKKRRAAA